MDFRKAFAIALTNLRITLNDRGLLLTMFAAPLAITFIIASTFGNLGGAGDISISNIKVAVVNEDEGVQVFVQRLNYGEILTKILIPDAPDPNSALGKLIAAQAMTRDAAIAAVKRGEITAAIIIPKTFSASLNPLLDAPVQTTITLYRDVGSPVTTGIVASVLRSLVDTLTSGSVAVYAAGQADSAALKSQAQVIIEQVNQSPTPVAIRRISVEGEVQRQAFNPLSYFAPAMAVFFLTFTMSASANSIMEERRDGTLQRMVTTPTSSNTVLAGKLIGTYLLGLIQLLILIVIMAFLPLIVAGATPVWGPNPVSVIIFTAFAVAGACGVGTILAALPRTIEQANAISTGVLMLSGMLGGTFFDISGIPVVSQLSRLTMNYWAINGYQTLARTGNVADVLPNIAALAAMFAVFFGIAIVIFRIRIKA